MNNEMNCETLEELFPAYAESDLSSDDRARVDAHVAECDACRESLRFFVKLESSLVARSAVLPSPTGVAAAVVERLGLGKQGAASRVPVGLRSGERVGARRESVDEGLAAPWERNVWRAFAGLQREHIMLRALIGLPGILSVSFIGFGAWMLMFMRPALNTFSWTGWLPTAQISPTWVQRFDETLDSVAAMGDTTLIGAYLGVFALILLMGSWTVMRYVRD